MDQTTIDFTSLPPATPADDALTLAHDAERAYLRGLATALHLDDATVAAIHAGAGKAQL